MKRETYWFYIDVHLFFLRAIYYSKEWKWVGGYFYQAVLWILKIFTDICVIIVQKLLEKKCPVTD